MVSDQPGFAPERALEWLPECELTLLASGLTERAFAAGEAILQPGPSPLCHFVASGLVSLQFGRDAVEVGLVGRGGFLNVGAIVGTDESAHSAIAITKCRVLSANSAALRNISAEAPALRHWLGRCLQSRITMAMEAAVCHLVHPLQPRLASWLMTATRLIEEPEIAVTHMQLAQALGVRRPTITLCLQTLEGEGAIRSRRARIVIRNADLLRSLSCGCSAGEKTLAAVARISSAGVASAAGSEMSAIEQNSRL